MTVRTMIVDDQEDVRFLLRVVIEAAHTGVEIACEAATGVEALALIECCNPRVVVLDQMMPGLNGVDTAVEMLARRPQQVVVLCSAYLDDAISRSALDAGVAAVVSKDDVNTLPALITKLVV